MRDRTEIKDSIIIVGGFHEIIELASLNHIPILGLVENDKKGRYNECDVLGTDEEILIQFSTYGHHPLIITPDSPKIRQLLYYKYKKEGYSVTSLISKEANISSSALIKNGSIIQSGVRVSCLSTLGECVKLNYNCNVCHDVSIGSFTSVAPNAVILGNVKIGENCYIGANSTILPGLTIGNNAVIGAGAVVTKNVEENTTVKGNPAR